MTSSQPIPRPRRLWRWLAVFLILIAAAYAAGWFYVAGKVEQEVDRAVARLGERGIRLDCGNRQVTGFPLSLSLTCDSIAYDDPQRNVRAATGALEAGAHLSQPLTPTVAVTGPLSVSDIPGLPDHEFKAEWRSLQADAHLWWPNPSRISVESTDVAATMTTLNDPTPKKVFSTATIAASLMPEGSDLDYAGNFTGLVIDPAAIEGRNVPALDGSAAIRLANGVAFLKQRPKSLRGQSAEIRNLSLMSGDGSVAISGPVSVDGEGLIDAALEIKLTNPPAISAILQQAVPEKASEIKSAFIGLGFLGPEPKIPFRIVKGKPMVLGFSLGEIKPLD
ncbi:MAG: DUF2125 domain-containing protein [Rhizobiaceae bacterium]